MLRDSAKVAPTGRLPDQFVAVDTETTGLYHHKGDRPFCAAFVFGDGRKKFYRWDPRTLRALPASEGPLEEMFAILADPNIDKVMHNAKFDWNMFEAIGATVCGRVWDTGTLCHLLDGRNAEGDRMSLDNLMKKYLPNEPPKVVAEVKKIFDELGLARGEWDFQLLPAELLYERCMGDAEGTCKLFKRVFVTVEKTFPYLLQMERELLPVVRQAENRGLLRDAEEAQRQMQWLETIVDDVTLFAEGMLDWSGWNINSSDHQAALLQQAGCYDQIKSYTKPKKNRKSTKPFVPKRKLDSRTLLDLHHPAAYMLLAGKAAAKMISPFLTSVLDLADANGVIHPNYLQNGTVGSRFACRHPNLQNIPVEGDRKAQYTEDEDAAVWEFTDWRVGQHIKRVFLCRPGFAHIHLDKKQAEMFALGHYTRDNALIEILSSGQSVHDGMCLKLFGEITKGLKQRSKAVTFGYQYGAGIETTARKAMCDIPEARRIRMKLGTLFSKLDPWKAALAQQVADRGFVMTDTGRRYYLKEGEEYMAVNRICQGHVGDELKSRMVAANKWLRRQGFTDVTILMNIHDEMVVEAPIDQLPELGPALYRLMLDSDVEHAVPIPSDVEVTFTRWSDLKQVERPDDPKCWLEHILAFQAKKEAA